MKHIRAITFDLDDTLWDIGLVIQQAEQAIYEWLSVHCPRVTERFSIADMQQVRAEVVDEHPEYSHDLSHLRWLSFYKILSACGYDGSLADRVFEEFMILRNTVELFPDAQPALDRLSQAYPLASLTNGNADLERIGIRHHFTATISARDHGVAKPHPALFHVACRALDCEPAEVLHVGDSPEHDVVGALEAGLEAAWLNRRGEAWENQEPAAGIEVRDLEEIVRLFDL